MTDKGLNPPKTLGVGVWGIGDHARRTILPALVNCRHTKLFAVGSRNSDVRKAQGEKWHCQSAATLDALLQLPDIDAVFVATPIGRHFDDGRAVLEAGKHLWCEKAFTATLGEAQELLDIAAANDLAVCVSCPPLYHPQFKKLSEMLKDESFGRVHSIDAHFGFPHVSRDHSKYDPLSGGSAMLDLGFYPLVMAQHLFADMPSVSSAVIETEDGYQIDTSGTALLHFDAGAHVTARWGYGRDYVNEIRISAEQATLVLCPAFSKPPNLPPTLIIRRQNIDEVVEIPETDQFVSMLDEFAATSVTEDGRTAMRDMVWSQQTLLSRVQLSAA